MGLVDLSGHSALNVLCVGSRSRMDHEYPDLNRLATLAIPLVFMAVTALSVKLFNIRQVFGQGRDLVDERDKLIESRASALAYQVLMIGMIVVGFVLPFSATRWELIDTAFFAIVVAEIVHSVVIVRAYRQGIHV